MFLTIAFNKSIISFHQTYKGEMSYMLNKKETALLVIDMQYGGGAPDGSLVKMLKVDVTKQEDIVTPIIKLKDYFNENGMLVVNIKTEYEEDFSDWKMLAERFEVKKYKHFVKGSLDAEIIPPLAPREGEELVIKHRWNAFFNTNLDELLKSKNIKNLILVGAATDVCVFETCSYAFSLNYNCIVPIETTASFNAERKQMGLEMLKFGRAQVVNVEEVYKMFE
ncbi:MAG: cysteine hydrolase [Clostridium thermopalmarium]|nr:cysteine hydrolase [Clostridium thermopalmarium]